MGSVSCKLAQKCSICVQILPDTSFRVPSVTSHSTRRKHDRVWDKGILELSVLCVWQSSFSQSKSRMSHLESLRSRTSRIAAVAVSSIDHAYHVIVFYPLSEALR